MIICVSGQNLTVELYALDIQLVFLIQICLIILSIRVVAYSHPPVSGVRQILLHVDHAATACAGSRQSSFFVINAQMRPALC